MISSGTDPVSLRRIVKAILPQSFILAIAGAILLAWLWPLDEQGTGFEVLKHITDYGIALIFFFYGLKLEPAEVKRGILNFRLHLAVQSNTFLLFPAIVLLFYPFVGDELGYTIWLGFFFLACLPSSVSSSVVMVSIADGNIPGAIFNASLSGVVGIVLTPLWMNRFVTGSGDSSLSGLFISLVLQVLLPIILGIVLHPLVAKYVRRIRPYLGAFDKSIILMIIYKSFCISFGRGVFSRLAAPYMLLIFGGVVCLFFTVLFLMRYLSFWLRFSWEDRIALEFCGTKKSLIHGSVFHSLLFRGVAGAGIILLPIILYHSFQIFFISWLANRYGNRERTEVSEVS